MLATAPQTETRFNGLTHGASAKELLITGENPVEFLELLNDSFPRLQTGQSRRSSADDLNRFDRCLTTAARTHQRALTNVRNMHRENIRTSQWKQLHELQKRKYNLQIEKFEFAKAREKRTAEKHEIRKIKIANKALAPIRSAKNAVPSPSSELGAQGSGPSCTRNTRPNLSNHPPLIRHTLEAHTGSLQALPKEKI